MVRFQKKAQMEAFGLAIIVILIALGMFFVIRFTILAPPKEVKQEFVQSQLSQNMISAILKTKPEASTRADVTELFRECAEQSSGCSECACQLTAPACGELQQILTNIFDNTLKIWKKDYLLKYPNDEGCIFEVKQGECKFDKDVASGFTIVTDVGPKPIYFELCAAQAS